ncbi:hypothetical protein BDQ12DRAFT_690068 [Crucibulum laeve]|uniref:SH3 domain-containing protein n=1 Tax=Crucibulum laeve TaxID=68775 RepID=A0A5C3LN93_9AGAR|nr:hypothetical protein BDQ12DRAFT_690068 [Crucibulum laeve]
MSATENDPRRSSLAQESGLGAHVQRNNRLLPANRFFLITLVLSVIAWAVSLIAQGVVASDFGNAFVGPLWFAILIQLGIIIRLYMALRTDSSHTHRIQLVIFAAMAVVFGVNGVDRNIFSGQRAQQALAAGWLISSIINVLWILHLTSEPSSFVLRILDPGAASQRDAQPATPIPVVKSKAEAFGRSPSSNGFDNPRASQALTNTSAAPRTRVSSAMDPEAQKRRSAGVWEAYTSPPSGGDVGSVPMDRLASGGAKSEGDASGRVTSQTVYRAEALFEYTASADDHHELSFAKGEILEVIDKSGKWWEARKADGKTGIAPSNYLRIL